MADVCLGDFFLSLFFPHNFLSLLQLGIFSSCGDGERAVGYSLVAVHGLLIVVASLVAERRLRGLRASVVAARKV